MSDRSGHRRPATRELGDERPKLAVICDFLEEGWASMDLVADQLLSRLSTDHTSILEAVRIRAPFRQRVARVPGLGARRQAFNADRLLNRLYDYPRYLARHASTFDCFHICDHSYAHVVHRLPGARTGVFCHDLDTFRSILEPQREPRPRWFREMARHILSGMQRAAVVFHSTSAVRAQIERAGLIDSARLVQARYGISASFQADSIELSATVRALLERLNGSPFLLHVGSCIPRKRVDVLLEVFAGVRGLRPELKLLQIGGEWSAAQRALIDRHRLQRAVVQVPRLSQEEIAQLYQRAALVLMPSEAEGFGLPVIEALACGAIVVASDIPVFREVGGPAVVFCPLADIQDWVTEVHALLGNAKNAPERADRLSWAGQYSWDVHARVIASAYGRLGA
ncbi:MAG TPA: glycosyltransferase [Polyangiaceae bacterium]|nr:glycosyltransferase [Polyangiaceae bacterium]